MATALQKSQLKKQILKCFSNLTQKAKKNQTRRLKKKLPLTFEDERCEDSSSVCEPLQRPMKNLAFGKHTLINHQKVSQKKQNIAI